jgi:hypothetical protein
MRTMPAWLGCKLLIIIYCPEGASACWAASPDGAQCGFGVGLGVRGLERDGGRGGARGGGKAGIMAGPVVEV